MNSNRSRLAAIVVTVVCSFIAGMALSHVWILIVDGFETRAERARLNVVATSRPSPQPDSVVERIAEEISPSLVEWAWDVEPEVIADSHSAVERWAIRRFYPSGVRRIPQATQKVVSGFLDRYQDMTIYDISKEIAAYGKTHGKKVDETVLYASQGRSIPDQRDPFRRPRRPLGVAPTATPPDVPDASDKESEKP